MDIKINYTIPIDIYKGYIYEYDLSKANISSLLYTNYKQTRT